jgi:UDP-2,4-diacetamido-2,4,6-trideoxy-beta-L-altropyranose hydrolase
MNQRSTDGKRLLVRADADARLGIGHMMRCLALAQAWQRHTHGAVTFIGRLDSESLRARLARQGFGILPVAGSAARYDETEVLPAGLQMPEEAGAAWYVVDGYHFDLVHHRALRKAGFNVLVIDDNAHLPAYEGNIILNQNLHAEKLRYRYNPDAVHLLGTRYALLRQEFLPALQPARMPARLCRRILVTLGGADPGNVSLTVLKALKQLPGTHRANLEVRVIAGPANPHLALLKRASINLPFMCTIVSTSDDMPALMNWADLAISAAGSTCWELAYLGVPFGTIVVADNQKQVAEGLAAAGVAMHFGHARELTSEKLVADMTSLMTNHERRCLLVAQGRRLVDGHGAARVVEVMAPADLRLRLATADDRQLLFTWANDPVVRNNSFHSNAINWEEHCAWFLAKIQDPACVMFLAFLNGGPPLGLARFNMQGHSAMMSVSLAAEFRGRGWGSRLISRACEAFFVAHPVTRVNAYIKQDNVASQHAFAKAGFSREPDVPCQGEMAVMMSLRKEHISCAGETEKEGRHACTGGY